jgi:hypothetical protein
MWPSRNRVFLCAAGALAAGLVCLTVGATFLLPKQVVFRDPTFNLTFCTITSGTNHTIFSGGKLLARLNRKLMAFRIHPITRARMYQFRTLEPAVLLGVGYRGDADSLESSVHSERHSQLNAVVVDPAGTSKPLRKRVRPTLNAGPGEHICMWLMPEGITNFEGCQLRLSRAEDGTNVAIIRLQ